MKDERFGRSPDETDAARQSYAKGTVLLGADVDQGCEIARGKGIAKMLVTTNDYVCAPDLVAAVREFIPGEGGCVVSIWQMLEELSDKFGNRLPVSPNIYRALDLLETLWADSHVNQVPNTEAIEFAWNEKGFDQARVTGLKALLRDGFQIPSATKLEI